MSWNLVFATLGALGVLVLSQASNTWETTIIRAASTFVLFFLIMFLFRYALSYALYEKRQPNGEATSNSNGNLEDKEGNSDSEDGLQNTLDWEENTNTSFSDDEAKKTSEMIRTLLNDENDK